MMQWLHGYAAWLLSLITYIPKLVWQYLTDDALTSIDLIFSICTACDLKHQSQNFSTLGDQILYMLWWFHIDHALGIFACAYVLRFLIRRLPVIG